MRILVTNDDGITAPGIELLARLASARGEVWVVAPDAERSGVSHAITLYRPLRIHEVAKHRFTCDGTPTDCVYLAINQMGLRPDLVLSGINAGPNLAHDVLYSGTVSAALEAAHWGVPSVALSHCAGDTRLLARLPNVVDKILDTVVPIARKTRRAINVNLPSAAKLPYAGIRAARLGHRVYSNEVHERTDPRGRRYYWIGGAKVQMNDIPGSDCNAVRDNFVSVTPLGDDLTLYKELPETGAMLDSISDMPLGIDAPQADSDGAPALPGIPFE